MNYKLRSSDFYNKDYKLSEREELYFNINYKTPYCQVRSIAYNLEISHFGTREEILRKIEDEIIKGKNYPDNKSIKKNICIDINEKLYKKESENTTKEKKISITELIPEFKSLSKNKSYDEIYYQISNFTDPHMVFINAYKDNFEKNLLSSIFYFPYIPEEINKFSNEFIIFICQYFGIKSNYNTISDKDDINILKQKLMDIYYLAEDTFEFHIITDCRNNLSNCQNLSSNFCENNLCKKCCEESTNKLYFCPIHDDLINLYRYKMYDLFKFENLDNKFDRKRVLRIGFKNHINIKLIEDIFNKYNVIIDSTIFKFKPKIEKIQYIYLLFDTAEDAVNAYNSRYDIINSSLYSKYQFSISPLMEDIFTIYNKLCNVDPKLILTSCLIVIPVSNTISNISDFPKDNERLKYIKQLINSNLNINDNKYNLYETDNYIANTKSTELFIVSFDDCNLLDEFYNKQINYNGIIIHKLKHLKLFPFIRNKLPNWDILCYNCLNRKNDDCIYDLCEKCCRAQVCKNSIRDIISQHIKCPCNIEKNICQKCIKSKTFCGKCEECCCLQIEPEIECQEHKSLINTSYYIRKYIENQNAANYIKEFRLRKSKIKLILLNSLRNGDFTWFRPIADTKVERLMLDMNKELTIIMDNNGFKRERTMKITDKMYKLYTYQLEKEECNDYYDFFLKENFDEKGDYYIEYDYKRDTNEYQNVNAYEEISENNFMTTTINQINSNINKKIDYHLGFYGLENDKLTNAELITEIFKEFRTVNIEINEDNIILLDEYSFLSYSITHDITPDNINSFKKIGRIALLKFESIKDALYVYLEKISLAIPLLNNKKGTPKCFIGETLANYI